MRSKSTGQGLRSKSKENDLPQQEQDDSPLGLNQTSLDFSPRARNLDANLKEIKTLREHLDMERNERRELKTELQNTNRERKSLEEAVVQAQNDKIATQNKLDNLLQSNGVKVGQVGGLTAEKLTIGHQVEKKQKQRACLEASCDASFRDVQLHRIKIEKAKEEDIRLQDQCNYIEMKVEKLHKEFGAIERCRDRIMIEHEKSRKERCELQKAVCQAKAHQRAIASQLGVMEEERLKLQQIIQAGTFDMRKLEAKLSKLVASKKRLHNKLVATEERQEKVHEMVLELESEHVDDEDTMHMLQDSKAVMQLKLHQKLAAASEKRTVLMHEQRAHLTESIARIAGVENNYLEAKAIERVQKQKDVLKVDKTVEVWARKKSSYDSFYGESADLQLFSEIEAHQLEEKNRASVQPGSGRLSALPGSGRVSALPGSQEGRQGSKLNLGSEKKPSPGSKESNVQGDRASSLQKSQREMIATSSEEDDAAES
jgi:hypothetical protein